MGTTVIIKNQGCLGGCFGKIASGFLILFVSLVVVALFSRRDPNRVNLGNAQPTSTVVASNQPDLLPEVAEFFRAHPEFGKPVRFYPVPNWFKGKRQNVTTDQGQTLLFYENGGKIQTVYRDDPPNPRTIVWGQTDK